MDLHKRPASELHRLDHARGRDGRRARLAVEERHLTEEVAPAERLRPGLPDHSRSPVEDHVEGIAGLPGLDNEVAGSEFIELRELRDLPQLALPQPREDR